MKNTFLKTAAGLFAAILLGAFVLSCEGPAGSNGSSGTIIPQVTTIQLAIPYFDVGYDTVRLVQNQTLAADAGIPDGKTLLVGSGVEITVNNGQTLTLGENATLQLEDGASLYFNNAAPIPSGNPVTVTPVAFYPGAKIAGSDGVESLTAGVNGGALLLTQAISASAVQIETDASLWSAGGKIAFAKSANNTGLLTTSKSQTDGEEAGTAENDLSASNGLAIADSSTAIAPSGIVAEGVLAKPSAANTYTLSTKSLKDVFDLLSADNPELVITNLQIGRGNETNELFTYIATTSLEDYTVYVPTGKTLYLQNAAISKSDEVEVLSGAAGTDVAYTINGNIKVSGTVVIGGRGGAGVATVANGGNIGGVTVKGTGSIELLKDANGTQLGKIYVAGAAGGDGDGANAGGEGGAVKVLVAIDGYVSEVIGGTGGVNSDTAASDATPPSGGKGGDVFVNANVKGMVIGGAGATGIVSDSAGAKPGAPGVGGNVYILGDVTGSTVQKETKVAPAAGISNGTLQGGAAGDNGGGTNGAGVSAQAEPGKVYAAKSVYAVKEDGTDVEAVTDPTDGFQITDAKGTTGESVGSQATSAYGGAGGDVIISGEATYIILP